MERDMRALAEKLEAAADAIRASEFERRRLSCEFEDQLHAMRDVLNQRLYGSYELEVADFNEQEALLSLNLSRRTYYPATTCDSPCPRRCASGPGSWQRRRTRLR